MSDSRKRHEILCRRPSYRKILDELQGQGSKVGDSPILPKSFTDFQVEEESRASPDGDCGRSSQSALSLHVDGGGGGGAGQSLLIPATSAAAVAHHLIQPPAPAAGNNPPHPLHASIGVTATGSASEDDEGSSTTSSGHHTLSHAVAMTPNAQHGSTLVQYGGVESQFYLPVSDLQNLSAYHHLPSGARTQPNNSIPGNVVNNLIDSNRMGEESTRKREMRLLKNREAARECRRKKKDYVKCLENRVAVLENQNKALIEELKSLKDLYCNKQD